MSANEISMEEFMDALKAVRESKGIDTPVEADMPTTGRYSDTRSPVIRFLHMLPPGLYKTSQEVADELNVSSSLIRKIARSGVLDDVPSTKVVSGNFKAYLYTKEDVEALKEYLSNRTLRVVQDKNTPKKEGE